MIYSLPEGTPRKIVMNDIRILGGKAAKVNKRLVEKYRKDREYLAVNCRTLEANIAVQQHLKELGGYKLETI